MNLRKQPLIVQLIISVSLIVVVSIIGFFSNNFIGYREMAIVLLMFVSILAMLFEIIPVLIASILSALIWNFFFIPPIFTFHIGDTEDFLMFMLYFVIASVNAVLTSKIRKAEKKARDKEEKENSIRLYNTLLNSLSHELRTPISTILGTIDALKDNKGKLSLDKEEELLNEIDVAAMRLNGQVENLLNMSRLQSGMLKINPDWCDINEMIFSLIQKNSSIAKHTIIFEPEEDLPLFKIDYFLIKQVLTNLLNNAQLYTPEGSKIELFATIHSGNLSISISDSGKGFTENERTEVFEQFYRRPNSKVGGLGLGLSIVKGFVVAHNGTILIENNEPCGARFTIIIPAETSYLKNLNHE